MSVASIAGGTRILPLQCMLAIPSTTLVSIRASSNSMMGFNSLQLWYRKHKKLIVRAARTESRQRVSLGFRAPILRASNWENWILEMLNHILLCWIYEMLSK
ncbi:hypothetical protein GH714_021092 [Hevea brasiliensis]|uniref:Uncharacterized protein n=1 Tax=Hevea brasiliensis TaxID=3981 RepID=A0A6A6KQN3_HEVBR|nr:hypothetical protein GH714_021092 [Hevea brasiliensis]